MKNKKQTSKLPSVTVAVCAFNEQYNIKAFLESVIRQKEVGFKLDKILVISDGSTDQTVKFVQKLKFSKIELRDHKERVGKSSRLNEIYDSLSSDIVVQADADVVLGHKYVIRDLIAPIVRDSKVGLTGGHCLPLPATTFIEKAVNCSLEAYIPIRKSLRGGNNVLSATGRLMAVSKDLGKKIKVPVNTISNDGFTYFTCLVNGFKYHYVPTATAYFRSPQNLYDHLNQNTRFLATPAFMKRYFPTQLVDREYYIPTHLLYWNMARQWVKHPILSGFIFLANRYCQLKAFLDERRINALWEVVYSTKKLR